MNDFLMSFIGTAVGGAFCFLAVYTLRTAFQKIASSDSYAARRLIAEYEFHRLAWKFEQTLGQLSADHYRLLEDWPADRMSKAIEEEKLSYSLKREALISEFEKKFEMLVEGLGSDSNDLLSDWLQMHSSEFPSLGLINQVS